MKNAVVWMFISIMIFTSLVAAQAAIAGEPSPCQGVAQTGGTNIKNKAELERAIAKQLEVLFSPTAPSSFDKKYHLERAIAEQRKVALAALKAKSVTVLQVFACENWSIIHVKFPPNVAEDVYLFYPGNPLTSRYVTMWGGDAWGEDGTKIRDLVLKNAPGIPPKLASCFALHVTH